MNKVPYNHHLDSIYFLEWLEIKRKEGKLKDISERWGYEYKTLCRVSYGNTCVTRKMIEKYKEER